MDATRIPDDVAAAIEECWPEGVVEEFDRDESYFQDIHAKLERDLKKIPGASLMWQTEAEADSAYRDLDDDDWDDELPPSPPDFQSYHVFFLALQGSEFIFETETESMEEQDPLAPDGELTTVTYPGKGRCGCSAALSLATPFAIVSLADYAQFEDGGTSTPDPSSGAYFDQTGKRVDLVASHRKALGEDAFAKLESLRARIAKVLAKHGVALLDEAILDLPVPELKADGEVFMSETLSVRDAFSFRGV